VLIWIAFFFTLFLSLSRPLYNFFGSYSFSLLLDPPYPGGSSLTIISVRVVAGLREVSCGEDKY